MMMPYEKILHTFNSGVARISVSWGRTFRGLKFVTDAKVDPFKTGKVSEFYPLLFGKHQFSKPNF